tara:strand:- start:136 stop:465 length:330 start_codon:yes stop_codon:yes gene_type:complete
MKYIILALLFLSQGCATPAKSLKDFKTTKSICVDGVLINMYAGKCDEVGKKQIAENIHLLTCLKNSKEKQDTIWLLNDFFILPQGSAVPRGIMPLCGDPHVILGTAEKD